MTASLRILSSKADSNTSGKGLPSHFWNRNIIRSILPGLRRKITGLLLSVPMFSFQIKVNFVFHLEMKAQSLKENWRGTESMLLEVQCEVSSQWWFGVPWRLLVLVRCVLSSPKSMQPSTRRFWNTLCFHLLVSFMEMLISFSSRILASAHTVKTTSKWFADHDITVLDWPANSPYLNPIWDIVKMKIL